MVPMSDASLLTAMGAEPGFRVVPATFDAGGRGLAASETIARGEEVLKLPVSMLLAPERNEWCTWSFDVLDELLAAMGRCDEEAEKIVQDGWQMRLALLLLIEKHKVGSASRAWPFISSLPTALEGSGCWAADGSISEESASAGSRPDVQLPRLTSWLLNKLEFARRVHAACLSTACTRCFGGVELSLDELLWAMHHITTRSFEVLRGATDDDSTCVGGHGEGAESPAQQGGSVEPGAVLLRGLVPIFDHINHGGSECNVVVSFSVQRQVFVLKALRDIAKGKQLTRDYGSGTNAHYFATWGFVPAQPNPHDKLLVDFRPEMRELHEAVQESQSPLVDAAGDAPHSPDDSSVRAAHQQRSVRLLNLLLRANIFSAGANAEMRDASAVAGFVAVGPKLLCCARLMSMPFEALGAKLPVMRALTGQSVSKDVDRAAAELIRTKLVAARDELPTTLAQDRASLLSWPSVRMTLRVAEKALLEESIDRNAMRKALVAPRPAEKVGAC